MAFASLSLFLTIFLSTVLLISDIILRDLLCNLIYFQIKFMLYHNPVFCL